MRERVEERHRVVAGDHRPVSNHVTAAVRTTTPRVRPVFCTTESMVIRPWSTWMPGPPGVPVPHCEGSL